MTAGGEQEGPEGASGGLASPACAMGEVDPSYVGLAVAPEPRGWEEVRRWRRAERERLVLARLAFPAETRTAWTARIATTLEGVIGSLEGRIMSLYWPFRGEPDLRSLAALAGAQGGRTALPVVVEKGKPLLFRAWAPRDRLVRGVWNIPTPAPEAEIVTPDVVIAPVVGFDRAGYRLGYGGGFFDRTLAAMARRPQVIGVGYGCAAIPTIHPQPHDIAMDVIVTEEGVMPAGKGAALAG